MLTPANIATKAAAPNPCAPAGGNAVKIAEEAFGITLPLSVVVAALGPVNAEMNLDTNTAHGAVYVLFPLLLMAHILAL